MRWFLSNKSSDIAQPEEPKPNVLARWSSDISSLPEALKHFQSPGVPPPPSSRVGDPKLKQRESQPLRLWHWWKFGAFAAVKGEHLRFVGLSPPRLYAHPTTPQPQHLLFSKLALGENLTVPH